MEWLVGLLAIITLLIVIGFAVTHFAKQMREPRNRDAARNTLREDGSSAHTAVRGGETPEHLK
ncbi:protein of unknown function [Beijerinckiaceae bacterium RH AL1]|nr:protein of unknown function [Beijerinckiaceae bacterium RH CH11]VVB44622.1 protein of unknown function [Beijerinckiaceae bacterium RH AL8]VVC54411.1 protein of unknown function [Beijerinckiaceae bacterium RH AL1]